MSKPACRRGMLAVYLLLALAAVALPVEASQPVHVHHGEVPGLYNGDCPLMSLAAFHGAAPLPSPTLICTGAIAGAGLVAPVAVCASLLLRHRDPRAPPLRLI